MKKALLVVLSCSVLLALPSWGDCPLADLTGDCRVDMDDFSVVSRLWLDSCDSANAWCSGADFDQSGSVIIDDLVAMVSDWQTGFRFPEAMVIIPAGTFQMGNSTKAAEGDSDELPVHTVTLDSFAMGKYEVTNGQYCAFLNSAYPSQLKVVRGIVYASSDTGNSIPYCFTSTSSLYSQIVFSNNAFSVRTKGGRDMSRDPMIMVTWYGAVAYCNWRSQQEGKQQWYDLSTWNYDFSKKGYRLPTEAEWEYAARGGWVGMRFPWGDKITHSEANYLSYCCYSYDTNTTFGYHPTWNDGIKPYTSQVGSFLANSYGLCDMAGNVWEWCQDWWSDSQHLNGKWRDGKKVGGARGRIQRKIRTIVMSQDWSVEERQYLNYLQSLVRTDLSHRHRQRLFRGLS